MELSSTFIFLLFLFGCSIATALPSSQSPEWKSLLSTLAFESLKRTSLAPLQFLSMQSVQEIQASDAQEPESYRVQILIKNPWNTEGMQVQSETVTVPREQLERFHNEGDMKRVPSSTHSSPWEPSSEYSSHSPSSNPGRENEMDLESDTGKKIGSFAVDRLHKMYASSFQAFPEQVTVKKITSTVVAGVVYKVLLQEKRGDTCKQRTVTIVQHLDGSIDTGVVSESIEECKEQSEASSQQVRTATSGTKHGPGGRIEITPTTHQVGIMAGYAFKSHELEHDPNEEKKIQLIQVERAFRQVVEGVMYDLVLRLKDISSNSVTQEYLYPIKVWHHHSNTYRVITQDEKYWIPPTFTTTKCKKCEDVWRDLSHHEYSRCRIECEK